MKVSTLIGILLIIIAIGLGACQSAAPAPATEAPAEQAPACPTPEPCPPAVEPVVKQVPFEQQWVASGHNKADAEAFRHWDETDDKAVPVECAKCHSETGYLDFLGEDGSAAGTVDNPAPIGTTITCVTCHNASTAKMTSVTFPSGAEVSGLGREAVCMQCHQGRASKLSVDSALEEAGLTNDLDTPNPELGFVNIHYFAAAATLYGTVTKGGYEYDGKQYDFKNDHVAGFDTCIGCHNPHTLELKLESCATCHPGVASVEDVRNIRMAGSGADYDGDGDIQEGIASEIEGLQEKLMTAIQSYATEVAGQAIGYNDAAYPYFFADTNGDGAIDESEAVFDNRYQSWTGRLLKAAYNYQTSKKDPGAFAHGGKYIIQLLYDSIEDLNTKLSSPVSLESAQRIDPGHFAGSQEAFRHWDAEGEVPGSCARCHSASGLPTYLKNGVNIAVAPANGFNCATCHNDLTTFTRFEVGAVTFPSGAKLDFGNSDANLCLNCHQGRESTVSVDRAIQAAGVQNDQVSEALSFRNPHYFAAGATLFGNDAKGAYQFSGKEYAGKFEHVANFNSCVNCHDVHTLQVKVEQCSGCHTNVKSKADLELIRMNTQGDFDGDGDDAEGLAGEVETMMEKLYAAIQEYAATRAGAPIAYDSHAYPYFFNDTNGNGQVDPEEAVRENSYKNWTPNLLRAAYNYQWAQKDPGAFAHNGKYILQVLYDSIQAVGGSVSGMTRP
ncbi:MAG: hypothetical protein Kow0088_22860 [Anaerolineales bacterium]